MPAPLGPRTHCEVESVELPKDSSGAEEAYEFALANRGVLTQKAIAQSIGVCQATVSNWQTDLRRPRALSDRLTDTVLPEA